MTAAIRADDYLTIPASYGGSLGGLVWSSNCDALERWNGTTLAFAEEIRDLLEGVFSRPPVPPFAFVLTLLRIMKDGPDEASVPLDRLWRAYTEARGAPGVPRNAGLLMAELCRGLPAAHDAPEWSEVALALVRRGRVGNHWSLENVPPLTRDEFVNRIESRLQDYDEAKLVHWLTHGCDPSGAGEKLAEEVESLPVRVARLLAAARRRQRLVGAAALVPSLDAALTIPPRRPAADAIPQGGYCDVTTRGEPERLLPGQFALEPDEFIRRYAEHELLYFKREEPHDVDKPVRIIILDQGVRTWGSVRLALAGAAFVLLKKDSKRLGGVRLATTGAVDPIDITEEKVEAVADLLESSDLTAYPEVALGRIMKDEHATGRDIVLLTHPRNLRELQVLHAAADVRPNDRLFALAVDDRGHAELSEWTPRGLVALRSFRVDLEAAEAAKAEDESARKPIAHSNAPWTGDIEPVPFPFRPGLVAEPLQFGFEANGEWLVMSGRDGLLQALAFDGSVPEVLPRPFLRGVVLKQVEAILGVNGGVVVCGRMRVPATPHSSTLAMTIVSPGAPVLTASASGPAPSHEVLLAAHYDLPARRVTIHELGPPAFIPPAAQSAWSVYPDLHCIAICKKRAASVNGMALDLETGGRYPVEIGSALCSRARLAWSRCQEMNSLPFTLPVRTKRPRPHLAPDDGPHLYLNGNSIAVWGADERMPLFEPQRDGKPLLAGAAIEQAQLAGSTLLLALRGPHRRQLVLIDGPGGRVLGELPRRRSVPRSALSADGRLLVSVQGSRALTVHETHNITSPLATATWAGLHDRFDIGFDTGPVKLVIRIGGFEHIFRVENEELTHSLLRELRTHLPYTSEGKGYVHLPLTEYDLPRFPSREIAHQWGWRVVRDTLGQILLYRHEGQLVAAFLVRREKAAVWIPEGVYWGDPALIGGPASPNAARRIGSAIDMAEELL